MLKTVGRLDGGRRRLSQGDRPQSGAGRSLVEPRESEDRTSSLTTDIAAMEQALGRADSRTTTASISSSRWARRCTIAGGARRHSPIMRRAMRSAQDYHPFNAEHQTQLVDRCIELFTAERPASVRAAATRPTRSSSSECRARDRRLVEQILSSHSLVEGTSELPDMPAIARGPGQISGVRRRADRRRAPRGSGRNI